MRSAIAVEKPPSTSDDSTSGTTSSLDFEDDRCCADRRAAEIVSGPVRGLSESEEAEAGAGVGANVGVERVVRAESAMESSRRRLGLVTS